MASAPLWTAKDDERLRLAWGEDTLTEVAASLGRTETATYWRGIRLGLPGGCPRGYEYLTRAASRVGYDSRYLRRILATLKVEMRQAFARPRKESPKFQKVYVLPEDVDEAVRAWEEREVVEHAAVRRGHAPEWLRAALRRHGKRSPGRGRWWRLPSAVIDAAIAAELARPKTRRTTPQRGLARDRAAA